MSIKLRTLPTDENSQTFSKTVRVFSTGQSEEYLQWENALQTCIIGQHATTGPTQYAMARRLLSGDALTAFENATTGVTTETVATFKTALQALRTHVFPRKALRSQKRYMRRHMRKTRDISARVFVARIQEVNNYLNSFPPFAEDQKLDDYELLEIMEASVPKNWQRVFTQQGYVPAEDAGGIEKFLDFCERMEFSEEVTSKNNSRASKKTEKKDREDSPYKKKQGSNKSPDRNNKRSQKDSTGKYCPLHETHSHEISECKVMLEEAKKIRKSYGSPNMSNKSKRDYRGGRKQEDMHAVLEECIEEKMPAKGDKNKKGPVPSQKVRKVRQARTTRT